jgi:hypothetical protein
MVQTIKYCPDDRYKNIPQVRAQFAAVGASLLGDTLYQSDDGSAGPRVVRTPVP